MLELIDEVTNRPRTRGYGSARRWTMSTNLGRYWSTFPSTELLEHAVAEWMPVDAAIAIDSDLPLVELADHFSSMIQFGIRGAEINNHSLDPSHLDAWLDALAPDNREAWLGPCRVWPGGSTGAPPSNGDSLNAARQLRGSESSRC